MQRRGDAAEWAEPSVRPVRDAGPAGALAADQDDRVDVRANRCGGVVEQRQAVEQRLGLVAAESARPAAGDDRAEDQRITSILTGTDFPAGT